MTKLRSAGLVLLASIAACKTGGIELEQPVGDTHHVVSSTGGAKPIGTDDPDANVVVLLGDALAKKCNLEQQRRAEFKTYEKKLLAIDVDVLASVGKCLARDPNASLFVVGHTDPRADEDYDQKLGLLRADRARAAVVAQGIQVERIAIGSRGALDAEGTDEATWKGDRRVELFLAEPRSSAGIDAPQYGPGPGEAPATATPTGTAATPAAGTRPAGRQPRATSTPASRR